MGLEVASGVLGFGLVVVFAFLWGMAFAGYAVLVALRTKNAAAAQAATFAFFPLIFLSYTFVPQEYVTAEWLRVAATVNPTTYVFDAMRTLLNSGWETRPIVVGFAVTLGFSTLTGVAALWAARRATRMAS
jgi:ABC-2 type transport system permease protein